MDGWSIALLLAAAYVAVTSLIGLMVRRRNLLIAQFRERMAFAARKVERRPASPPNLLEEKAA